MAFSHVGYQYLERKHVIGLHWLKHMKVREEKNWMNQGKMDQKKKKFTSKLTLSSVGWNNQNAFFTKNFIIKKLMENIFEGIIIIICSWQSRWTFVFTIHSLNINVFCTLFFKFQIFCVTFEEKYTLVSWFNLSGEVFELF